MKTTWVSENQIERKWYLVDLAGLIPGRAATVIASLLIGKGKVNRVPNLDMGDYVVAINASKLKIAQRKLTDKKYFRYSGYPSGLKEISMERMFKEHPERIIELAVKNMLPKNKLQDRMMTRLTVVADDKHGHEAQKPELLKINS